MTLSNFIGAQGEQIATDYLLALGYAILERNHRVGHLEIDIIAMRGTILHFIEVKTRSCDVASVNDFMPESAMTALKKERLIRAAELYVRQRGLDCEWALELIAINIGVDTHCLRHYKDVQWSV